MTNYVTGSNAAERAAKMLALSESGRTLQQIGDEFGVSRERVRQILEKHGTPGVMGAMVRHDSARLRRCFIAGRLMMLAIKHTHAEAIAITQCRPRDLRIATVEHGIQWRIGLAVPMPNGTRSMSEASRALGAEDSMVVQRIRKLGWTPERAASEPRARVTPTRRFAEWELSLLGTMRDTVLARQLNRHPMVIRVARMKRGIPAFCRRKR